MSQLGQSQKRAEHGSFLHSSSAAGRKLALVQQTSSGSTSITLTAGQTGSIRYNLTLYPPTLPTSAQNSTVVIPSTKCVGWPQIDLFVDTNSDFTFEFGVGSALSAGQLNITSGNHKVLSPLTGTSQCMLYYFKNNDSSTHVIYTRVRWDFIIFGDYAI